MDITTVDPAEMADQYRSELIINRINTERAYQTQFTQEESNYLRLKAELDLLDELGDKSDVAQDRRVSLRDQMKAINTQHTATSDSLAEARRMADQVRNAGLIKDVDHDVGPGSTPHMEVQPRKSSTTPNSPTPPTQ